MHENVQCPNCETPVYECDIEEDGLWLLQSGQLCGNTKST